MIIRLTLLFLCCCASCVFSAPPPVTFNNLSSAEGLPQNTARVLLQDRNGFMWVGTEDGLVRFDGYSMQSFRKQHNNPASLSDNYISALAESRDGRIWVGTMGGGLNVIYPQTGTVYRVKGLDSNDIRAITLDPSENELWLGSNDGLYRLNIASDSEIGSSPGSEKSDSALTKILLSLPDGSAMEETISGVVVQDSVVWFSTRGKGIGQYIPADDTTIWYIPGELGLEDATFNKMTVDQQGNIWAGGQNHGLVQLIQQPTSVRFKHYNKENSGLDSNDVMAITDAGNDNLWVGTWNGGLALLNTVTGNAELYRQRADDPHSLASDIVMDILQTRDGLVWIGTFDHGINWFNPNSTFRVYKAKPYDAEGLPGNLIWSFASENEKKLWVGSSKGLARLNLNSHEYDIPDRIQPKTLWDAVCKDDIRAMLSDGDQLWIAARHNGLVRLTLSNGKLTPITDLLNEKDKTLTNPYIRVMLKDSQGYLWFGATKGLNRFNPSKGELRTFMPSMDSPLSLPHQRVRALFEDSKGQIWVGTSQGLLLINEQGDPVRVWQYNPTDTPGEHILAGKGVRGLGEDSQNRIWIATEGGVSIYDPKTEKVIILREENGLPSNAAYSAIPIKQHMWISTLRGLARVNSTSLRVESYYTSDGLPDNEFNFNAWHRLNDGRLALGTLSGFSVFSPLLAPGPDHPCSPPPLQLQAYITEKNTPHAPIITKDAPVTVNWQNNHIAFKYSALYYGSHDNVTYDAFLQGIDQNWINVGSQRLASYSGLAPGRYVFHVRAKDRHGQWETEATPVLFTVTAPPWRTFQAYILYSLLAVGSMFLISMLYNSRLRNRAETLQLLVAERTAKLEESSQHLEAKNRQLDRLMEGRELLFKAVSHELRTPLTVIISILESVQNNEAGALTKLPMARKSARQLGRLLTSILDLSQHEERNKQGGLPFQMQAALEETISSYELQAQAEGKTIITEIPEKDIYLALPKDTFMLMISNLLSNACKYTRNGGNISIKVSVHEEQLIFSIDDDGIGIPDNMQDRIFGWFERGTTNTEINGWGIGLAFVREAAETAGGTIRLQPSSENKTGALFLLTLPLATKKLPLESFSESVKQDKQLTLPGQEKARTLLLVEDDPDLLQLLPTLFPFHWNCLTASTAETGWNIATQKTPDLVLTDLMLPGESGFDLTKKLKEDSRTAHIPVLILTALSDETHRLIGLGLSADSFMGKPFDNQELLLRVQGLISNRERVFERVKRLVIGREHETEKNKQKVQTPEDIFLQKLQTAFDTADDLSPITLDDAATKLAMSKRSLQREMQRLGISWREYKRLRKLRIAMDLLCDPTSRINIVAAKAGYSSAAHFSKIFKEHTGISPTEWKRLQHQE